MHIAAISNHARQRIAQRGFSSETVQTLYDFGRCKRRYGADVFFMDRSARRAAADALGSKEFARIEQSLNGYLVIADDGTLVTCAKRLRRIK